MRRPPDAKLPPAGNQAGAHITGEANGAKISQVVANATTMERLMSRGEALALAEEWGTRRGVPAFPIEISWDAEKNKTNKEPLTKHGFLDASTDRKALRLMFNSTAPWRGGVWGVGLYPGPAGYLVLDVDGVGAVDAYETRDLPATYSPTSASGSRHYWWRKPENVKVGTTCAWPEVDVVRSDDGYVVAPGTVTPWGSWECFDEFPADVTVAPAALWDAIDHHAPGGTTGSSGVSGRGYQTVEAALRAADRHQDAEALRVLCEHHGGHHPFMKGDVVNVTRPDKSAGVSATIGYVAPGTVKMFSSNWTPFAKHHRYIVEGDTLIDADQLTSSATPTNGDAKEKTKRQIGLRPASSFKLRRVRWLMEGRIALGTIALLAGPEGLGKSTIAYWIAARVTRGELPGELFGTPKSVLVCATEDSWEHTIVPRLLAHGADLERVYRIAVNDDGLTYGLTLPCDIPATIDAASQVDAALLILDPLMSRLGDLDTHRDSEVRQALEPLAAMGDRIGLSVLGLIHHNKSGSSDPLNLVMASKAFVAVARSVHTAIWDPENGEGEHRRLFGTPKNNLGSIDLPTLSYTIVPFYYPTEDGQGEVGQIEWGPEVAGTIADAIRRSDDSSEYKTAVADAAEWLRDYITANGPEVPSASIKEAAKGAGHAARTLHRARQKLGVVADTTSTVPPRTFWSLPIVPSRVGRHINGTTGIYGGVDPQVDPNCAKRATVPSQQTVGATRNGSVVDLCVICSLRTIDPSTGECRNPRCEF